ncbi:MAG: hypothetical protein ACI9AU_000302 [Bacteroidia bacterium]|jgi:hypothetical protein
MMKIINHVYLAIRLTLSQDHANFKNSHYQLLNKNSHPYSSHLQSKLSNL